MNWGDVGRGAGIGEGEACGLKLPRTARTRLARRGADFGADLQASEGSVPVLCDHRASVSPYGVLITEWGKKISRRNWSNSV